MNFCSPLHFTVPLLIRPLPLVLPPPLGEHLVWSSMPNGRRAPRFPALPAEWLLRRFLLHRESWVVVTQAGQLEGMRRGITSTSPPAFSSERRGGRAADRWRGWRGERVLIREGSVGEAAATSRLHFPHFSISSPRTFLAQFGKKEACECVCACATFTLTSG